MLTSENQISGATVCILGLALLLGPMLTPAQAEDDGQKTFAGFNFYFENDLFTGSDRNYTNGVKASFITKDLAKSQSDLAKDLVEISKKIPCIRDEGLNRKVEFALGQNMYTPKDISSTGLIPNDRPYAGWTYLSSSFHAKESDRYMYTFEVQAGIIGPESMAEETQKYVHREISNSPHPNGWDHQLETEPGVNLVFEKKWRLTEFNKGIFDFDAISHAGFSLGNVHTYLNGGAEVRCGWNLPRDFGVSLIRPAGSTRLEPDERPALYFFGAMDTRLVGRDIFLDGNTFADSHRISKKYLVADFAAGVAANYKRFRLTWTNVFRTKEFDGQPDEHSFASITISYFF